jgi:hypothetical protein
MTKMNDPTDWDDLLPEGYEWAGEEYSEFNDIAFDPDFNFELELFLHDEEERGNDEGA